MSTYQVIARRFRPQTFAEIVGQSAIVQTLQNSIRQKRLGHAYLLTGPRGTGKTTLARLFAKALNCATPTAHGEPCNSCSSCKEITVGSSLDVIEIDGASNRGIEEIRKIRDTAAFQPTGGAFRIYIIDEVHMLTNEAFNALLKTLEEPPETVKFLFATTEPHKVLPTIISRCQRFDLARLSQQELLQKLQTIAKTLDVEATDSALSLIAQRADGGMRDAESILDQLLAFHSGTITEDFVANILGILPHEAFFALDQAGKEGRFDEVFVLTKRLFDQGKDFCSFLESLAVHFRTLIACKLNSESILNDLTQESLEKYRESAQLYQLDHALRALDETVQATQQIKQATSPRIALEALLLRLLKIHREIPLTYLTQRLIELEEKIKSTTPSTDPRPLSSTQTSQPPQTAQKISEETTTQAAPAIQQKAVAKPPAPSKPVSQPPVKQPAPRKAAVQKSSPPPTKNAAEQIKQQSQYDTVMQFAAVELEGTLKRNH